ncbi:hypothetical protein OROMI_013079 [Orobanche minor]
MYLTPSTTSSGLMMMAKEATKAVTPRKRGLEVEKEIIRAILGGSIQQSIYGADFGKKEDAMVLFDEIVRPGCVGFDFVV